MRDRSLQRLAWAFTTALCSALGCSPELKVDDGSSSTQGRDVGICEGSEQGIDVDVLFVVDNSRSMGEEQVSLAREIPRLVKVLTQGDDTAAGDRGPGYGPARSVHVGVVSTDMGFDDAQPTGCKPLGDDGLLRKNSECDAGSGFVSYASEDGPVEVAPWVSRVACLTQLGTEGCGFEQPLEAMWKALAPAADRSFSGRTRGHGDAENAGFLRQDSLLVVVLLTDEDDCSFPDQAREQLFPTGGNHLDLNVRCGNNPGLLHPISRYAQGLRSLRKDAPERFLFAAITGLPIGLEGEDHAMILEDESMQFVTEPEGANGMVMPRAACETANGVAYPARRLVELADEFPDQSFVRSICRENFGSAMSGLADTVSKRMQRSLVVCQ